MSKTTVLVVEDERSLLYILNANLKREGYQVLTAKTAENGTIAHRLHALDVATGQQKASTLITATFTAKSGKVINFNSLHQMNRPGLLLNNGTIYVAWADFAQGHCVPEPSSGIPACYNADVRLSVSKRIFRVSRRSTLQKLGPMPVFLPANIGRSVVE